MRSSLRFRNNICDTCYLKLRASLNNLESYLSLRADWLIFKISNTGVFWTIEIEQFNVSRNGGDKVIRYKVMTLC